MTHRFRTPYRASAIAPSREANDALLTRQSWPINRSVLCLALLCACAGAALSEIIISAPREGRAFYTGESVRLMIWGDGATRTASFDVRDYWGRHLYNGSTVVGGSKSTQVQVPGVFDHGWYGFTLNVDGGSVSDAFCVIPRPWVNTRGDDGLFGLQLTSNEERQYAAAAQLGIRRFRTDVPWPSVEPTEGTYSFTYLQQQIQLCQKYGIRLMGLLDYTPSWNAEPPVNGPDDFVMGAAFTWHPRNVHKWRDYVEASMNLTAGKSVTWPSPNIISAGASYTEQTLPLMQSWELWNEADHCFYMGSWGRFMDMARILYGEVKPASEATEVVFGASTGNWLCMCYTCMNRIPAYFDRLAFHPDGTVAAALTRWYQGAFQLTWIDGYPRENALNEAYIQYADTGIGYGDHQQQPGDLFRITTQLRYWGQDSHYRSSCLHQWVAKEGDLYARNAMLLNKNGGLVPTPLYVAFAAARDLLTDATYVGPVDLGAKREAHIFLKHGRPLMVAWSDSGLNATISLPARPYKISVMGTVQRLSYSGSTAFALSREPLMLWGVDNSYVAEALAGRYATYCRTELGNDAGNTCWYGVDKLMDDVAAFTGSDYGTRLDRAMVAAGVALRAGGPEAPSELHGAMAVCKDGMMQIAARARAQGELTPRAIATTYRLARILEWLGSVADDRSLLWPAHKAKASDITAAAQRRSGLKSALPAGVGDAEPAFTGQLLDRARRQLLAAQQVGHKGALYAATAEMDIADALRPVEVPIVRKVFCVADFPTAVQLRKAHLLEANKVHTVDLTVHNYTTRRVGGTVRLSIPTTWQADGSLSVPFTAPANGISTATSLRFTIPGGAEPWQRHTPEAPDVAVVVEVPAGLQPTAHVTFDGELSDGTDLMTMSYPVYVGRLAQ